jgi:ribosomal protein L11 methyltransferase
MSEFAPQLERSGNDRIDRGRIFCLMEEERLDERLVVLSMKLEEIEQRYSTDFTIQVRNREGSEPPSGSDQFAESFQPISNLTIQPWNPNLFGQLAPDTILLDPESSFGTGKHPSTRLCLKLLDRIASNREQKRNLLDLGCGTGVLAISALKLGAASTALAVDIDPEAVGVAAGNVDLNDIAARVTVRRGSLDAVAGRFDLIVANLVPSVLLSVGSNIGNHLKEHGSVIVAGFRTGQAEMMADFFAGQGLRLCERIDREGWAALLLH